MLRQWRQKLKRACTQSSWSKPLDFERTRRLTLDFERTRRLTSKPRILKGKARIMISMGRRYA